MKSKAFLMWVLLLCTSCRGLQFATTEQWEWNTQKCRVTSAETPLFFHFGDSATTDLMNMQNCYDEPTHFVAAANATGNSTLPYVKHVLTDLPFRVDSVLCILGEQIVIFEQLSPLLLPPDYEIQSDSVVMGMRGEVFRPTSRQRADVVWRNIFVNKQEKRVLCLDRFYLNRRHLCVLYILQSTAKTLRPYHAKDWCGLTSWNAADPRNMMLTASFLDTWQWFSIDILNSHWEVQAPQ